MRSLRSRRGFKAISVVFDGLFDPGKVPKSGKIHDFKVRKKDSSKEFNDPIPQF